MLNILNKEIKLSASILSFVFIIFGFMFLLPGYPILVGAFFVTLGIFQSFQKTRETNDILFSALLPIAKSDVVKGKYLFVCFIEICSFLLMSIAVILRMTIFVDLDVYRSNVLMNANMFALGIALLIFAIFNLVFVSGFFKTGYKFLKPFVVYLIIAFITIGISETLHHFPGLEILNAFGFDNFIFQLIMLIIGIVLFILITFVAYKKACKRFEKIDL